MKEQEKVIFTKEEFAQRVKVPSVVEQDLKRIISDRLEQCGLYYRAFSRIKTSASMAHKFEMKAYGEERKLQDLVGVRVNLYFDDDVQICRSIMEKTFEIIDWSTSERNEDEFKPTKLNGVFRLPGYLKSQISSDTWDMYIDDTFEIQIKTMFFEGWHEIEHDMRYKGRELWSDYPAFSRYFNSILATLELCDKSMVTLFEDLGHALYKSGRWSDMIKSHFRLKLGDAQLYPEVEEILNKDKEENVNNIAKLLYKTDKAELVEQLLMRTRRIPINVNTIVALLNESKFHDSRLSSVFKEKDVYNDGREQSLGESRHYELKPLEKHSVFQMQARIDGNRIKTEEAVTDKMIFKKAAGLIYQWIVAKYGELFVIPAEVGTYHADMLAYHVSFDYDEEMGSMNMHVRHMDLEVGGRIWFSEAQLKRTDGKVLIKVCNGYAEPRQENQMVKERAGMFFSYPGYYKMITDTLGVVSGIECMNRRRVIYKEQVDLVCNVIQDQERQLPIVVIISKETQEGMMDETWLGQFKVSDFTRTVWRYTHVFTSHEKNGKEFLRVLNEREMKKGRKEKIQEIVPGFYIFWPNGSIDLYGPEYVLNCSFGRRLEARSDARTYDIVKGGQAFYHKILTDLRDWNVSVKM